MPLLAQQHNNPKDMKKDILDISAAYFPKLSVLFRGKPFHTVSFCMMNIELLYCLAFFSDIINSVIEELAISNMIIIIDDSITNKPLSSTSSYISAVSWLTLSS